MLEFLKQNLKQKKKVVIIILIILILGGYYILKSNDKYEAIDSEEILDVSAKNEMNSTNTDSSQKESQESMIFIHVTGAVKSPGVVEINEGSRIEDAINAAGGLNENADITNVNLAYILEDGMKIRIPSVDDEDLSENTTQSGNENSTNTSETYITKDSGKNVIIESTSTADSTNDAEKAIVNINKASQTELETLSGIGPSLASKIIAYREENGKFKSIEEIKNVSGIGDSKFEAIKDYITIK